MLLGTCCFFQVKESADKYFKKSTTTATNYEDRTSLKPPSFVFCPLKLYKPENVLKMNNMSKSKDGYGYEYWPSNQSLVQSAWNNITFGPEEMFEEIGILVGGYTALQGLALTNLFEEGKTDNMTFTTLDTIYSGRCYMITYLQNMEFDHSLMFKFKPGKVVFQ